jgi:hypothetical protein
MLGGYNKEGLGVEKSLPLGKSHIGAEKSCPPPFIGGEFQPREIENWGFSQIEGYIVEFQVSPFPIIDPTIGIKVPLRFVGATGGKFHPFENHIIPLQLPHIPFNPSQKFLVIKEDIIFNGDIFIGVGYKSIPFQHIIIPEEGYISLQHNLPTIYNFSSFSLKLSIFIKHHRLLEVGDIPFPMGGKGKNFHFGREGRGGKKGESDEGK